jgi:hypothetical protein
VLLTVGKVITRLILVKGMAHQTLISFAFVAVAGASSIGAQIEMPMNPPTLGMALRSCPAIRPSSSRQARGRGAWMSS